MFMDFQDSERVRRAAKELRGSNYCISDHKENVEQQRKLIPIMLQARQGGQDKDVYLKVDKPFINSQTLIGLLWKYTEVVSMECRTSHEHHSNFYYHMRV